MLSQHESLSFLKSSTASSIISDPSWTQTTIKRPACSEKRLKDETELCRPFSRCRPSLRPPATPLLSSSSSGSEQMKTPVCSSVVPPPLQLSKTEREVIIKRQQTLFFLDYHTIFNKHWWFSERVLPSIPAFCCCMCCSCFSSFRLFFPDRVMFALGLDLRHTWSPAFRGQWRIWWPRVNWFNLHHILEDRSGLQFSAFYGSAVTPMSWNLKFC